MAGGGDVPRPRAQAAERGGRRKKKKTTTAPSLPLDVVLEIAARSDPAILVRCAATCWGARRRVADDPGFRLRLRLRHADRFVPSLLRGHLMVTCERTTDFHYVEKVHMVDITATVSRPLTAAEGFPPRTPDGKAARHHMLVASRDGLLLIRTIDSQSRRGDLRVCDPATGRSRTLPAEPSFPGATEAQAFWEPYVLTVGDGDTAGGIRPFQVLNANLVLSDPRPHLQTQAFSSQKGSWGRYTEIGTHNHIHGRYPLRKARPLVAGGAVHWLCVARSRSYVLKLQIGTARVGVRVMMLPENFPRPNHGTDYLLATSMAAGGELVVLVADGEKISSWVQTKPTAKWEQRPQVVMYHEAMPQLRSTGSLRNTFDVNLHWFAERSGLVLLSSHGYGDFCFWLDLRSMEIVRWFRGAPELYGATSLPYEMDLASWVPTFGSTINLRC